MNKRFLLVIFAACMMSTTQNRAMDKVDQTTMAKVGGGLIAIGALSYASEWLFNTGVMHTACATLGLSPIGTRQIAFLSSSALSLGYLTSGTPEVSNSLFHFAYTAPFIGLTNILLNKQVVRKAIARIPVLGEFLVCPLATKKQVEATKKTMTKRGIEQSAINKIEKCPGSCNHCKAIDAVRLVAGWTIAKVAVPAALRELNIIK